MNERDPGGRLPLPSEDTGDLVGTPSSGATDDYLVAREEGVPYTPPSQRVIRPPTADEASADVAAAPRDDEEALRLTDGDGSDIAARVLAALRESELPAGDRLAIGVVGSTVHLRGEVESVDVLDEIMSVIGEVEGVDDVVDETTIRGL